MNKKQQKMSQQPPPKVGVFKGKSFAETLAEQKTAPKLPTIGWLDEHSPIAYAPVYCVMEAGIKVPGVPYTNYQYALLPEDLQAVPKEFLGEFVKAFMAEMGQLFTKKLHEAAVQHHYVKPNADDMLTMDKLQKAINEVKSADYHGVAPTYHALKDYHDSLSKAMGAMGKKWDDLKADPLLDLTMKQEPSVVEYLMEHFNGLDQPAKCPQCAPDFPFGSGKLPLHKVVVHLNDVHMLSREAIADWLETLDIDITEKEQA